MALCHCLCRCPRKTDTLHPTQRGRSVFWYHCRLPSFLPSFLFSSLWPFLSSDPFWYLSLVAPSNEPSLGYLARFWCLCMCTNARISSLLVPVYNCQQGLLTWNKLLPWPGSATRKISVHKRCSWDTFVILLDKCVQATVQGGFRHLPKRVQTIRCYSIRIDDMVRRYGS